MLVNLASVRVKRAIDDRGNVQQFLDRLFVEVASENYRYFLTECLSHGLDLADGPNNYCWPPLLSNERQVSGLFAIGLSRVCPVSSPEHPVSRGRRLSEVEDDEENPRDKKGRVDFLAFYGNRHIALEVKRCPISTLGDARSKKGLTHQWKEVSSQAKAALVHMRRSGKDHYDSPVSIGLLVVRVSRKVTQRGDIEATRSTAEGSLSDVAEAVSKLTKADYLSYYVAPREMQVSSGWGKSGEEHCVFPGMVFAAVVHQSIKGAAS